MDEQELQTRLRNLEIRDAEQRKEKECVEVGLRWGGWVLGIVAFGVLGVQWYLVPSIARQEAKSEAKTQVAAAVEDAAKEAEEETENAAKDYARGRGV